MTNSIMFTKPMLAKKFEDYESRIEYPVFVQPKLDGVRAIWDGQTLRSRTGHVFMSMIGVKRELLANFRDFPLDGELYCHSMGFDEISGTCRRHDGDDFRITYNVFDYPDQYVDLTARIKCLRELFSPEALPSKKLLRVILVPTQEAKSREEIEVLMNSSVAAEYEGVMIRNPKSKYQFCRTKDLLKYKRWKTSLAKIEGMLAGEGKHLGRLGALKIHGSDGWECEVGTGFSDFEREKLWNEQEVWIGQFIEVKFQETTQNGVPRFPVYLRMVNPSDLTRE